MNYFHHQQVTEDLSQFQICPALDSKVEQSHCEIQCLTLYSSIQFSTSTTKVSLLHPRGYLTAFLLDKSRKCFIVTQNRASFSLAYPSTGTSYLATALRRVLSHSRQCQVPAWPDFCFGWTATAQQTGRTQWRSLYQITTQASGPLDLPTKAFFAKFCMQIGNKRCKVLLLQNLHIQTRLHHTGQNQTGYIRKDDLG